MAQSMMIVCAAALALVLACGVADSAPVTDPEVGAYITAAFEKLSEGGIGHAPVMQAPAGKGEGDWPCSGEETRGQYTV